MEELKFRDNSEAMFNEVCSETPWFVRTFTRNGLVKGLREEGCGVVTEENMYDVCRKVTPEQYLGKTLGILDRHKTVVAH